MLDRLLFLDLSSVLPPHVIRYEHFTLLGHAKCVGRLDVKICRIFICSYLVHYFWIAGVYSNTSPAARRISWNQSLHYLALSVPFEGRPSDLEPWWSLNGKMWNLRSMGELIRRESVLLEGTCEVSLRMTWPWVWLAPRANLGIWFKPRLPQMLAKQLIGDECALGI